MMQRRKVLVPLDGSKFAECALPIAVEIAGRLSARVDLTIVSHEKSHGRHLSVDAASEKLSRGDDSRRLQYLESVKLKVEALSSAPVSCTLLNGPASRELVKYSMIQNPEMIVMATHGRGTLSRAWLGSVADWVVRHASMPVLLVHPEEGVEPKLTERTNLEKVLVALDGSSQAEQSLPWVGEIGNEDTSYILVRVARDSLPVWSVEATAAPFDIRDYSKAGCMEAHEYLHRVEGLVNSGHHSAKCVVVEGMPVAVGILKAAKEQDADLIAITTHGRGGLPRLILGSVTDKVVRASHVPVLVVRPQRS